MQSRIEAAEQESPGIWEKAISAPINYSDAMLEVVTTTENGIRVVVGAAAETPETLVRQYLAGTLATGENVCDH